MAAKQLKSGIPKSAGGSPAQTSKLSSLVDTQTMENVQETLKASTKEYVKEGIKEITEAMKEQMQAMQITMQASLQVFIEQRNEELIKEITEQMMAHVNEQNNKIREDIILAFKCLAAKAGQLEEKIETNVEYLEGKVEEVKTQVDKTGEEVVLMQYKSMEVALRIRGLKENGKENLEEVISEALAQEIEQNPEEIAAQIDKIYRVNSWIAKQRQLPRDVVIYFTNRKIRNEILQVSYKKKLQVAGKDILILKEIPSKMLKARKDYAFLADELKKRHVQFRWDVPAGIVVTYDGRRYRLNTESKARDFYKNVLKAEQHPSSPEIRRKKEQREAEQREEIKKREEQEKQPQAQAAAFDYGVSARELFTLLDPNQMLEPLDKRMEVKEPLEKRQTRADTRKEKELKEQQLQAIQLQGAAKSEPVGGARPKEKLDDLQAVLRRLEGPKDG